MDTQEFLTATRGDAARRQAVAEAAGTTVAYLWQIAGGHRRCSAELAVALERASDGLILREHVRPDLYRSDQA